MKLLLSFTVMLCVHLSVWATDIDARLRGLITSCIGTDKWTIVKSTASYCIVEGEKDEGIVIVSLKRNTKRNILGYIKGRKWNEMDMPPTLRNWFARLEDVPTTRLETENEESTDSEQRASVSPLLTCHWHQKSPYNDLSPVISDGNIKTVAGCVAIAAAQITYYWRKDNPEQTLQDTPTYPYGGAPVTVSIPKGSDNNWQLMLDSYTNDDTDEARYAVAQLCYVLGTTSYLNYASSTGGNINDAANAMYAQYRLLSEYLPNSLCRQEQWDSLIYSDLQKGYPIMCGGGGHAYVLDGYDADTDLYHFNFGWGGSWDGYYPIDNSTESMGGYADGVSIVYNIHPEEKHITADMTCRYADGKIYIDISVVNESTLPIRKLCLYVCPNDENTDSQRGLLWQSDGTVSNDGDPIQLSFSVDYITDRKPTLCLTDENGYTLAKTSLEETTAIDVPISASGEINTNSAEYYNMRGQRMSGTLHPGVYIKRTTQRTSKIVIK